ncbi:MAG: hypothetical protein U0R24_06840 [Solirubrobacterales bacterium]
MSRAIEESNRRMLRVRDPFGFTSPGAFSRTFAEIVGESRAPTDAGPSGRRLAERH